MAKALGKHPQLIAWQIDNGIGGHYTEASFNEDTRRDWHCWLKAKYETIERLNELMGLRHLGPGRHALGARCPMPMARADRCTTRRWCWIGAGSAATPSCSSSGCRPIAARTDPEHARSPPTCAPLQRRFDHFDMAEVDGLRFDRKQRRHQEPSPPSWPARSTCCARSRRPTSARRTATAASG